MKMTLDDLLFYLDFSPPREGERPGDYTKRRKKDWVDCSVAFDDDDLRKFHELAAELYFLREKPKGNAPRLTSTELRRQAIAQERERLRALPIYYSGTFEAHIFQGEPDGSKHKGLHSYRELLAANPAPVLVVIENDNTHNTYSAWVTLPGKTAAKASSFFPDNWDRPRVKAAIKDAFIDSRLNPGFSQSEAQGVGLSWVGRVNVDGHELMIGGLGDGDKPTGGIATAFPAVNGRFKDYN